MKKARALKLGDRIGIIAPSSPTKEENIERASRLIEDMGFKVKMGRSCYENYGYLAGRDELRAADINLMFADQEIDGIICMRGGYGSPRILDLIDYELIRNKPKVFVGYSDITALHIAFNQLADLVTFHGPMVASDMLDDFSPLTRASLLDAIMGRQLLETKGNLGSEELVTINPGLAEGIITGGNLSLIAASLATPYEIDTRDKLLLIEEISEEPYAIDRMLTQLRLAGKLEEAKGFILGDFNNCQPKNPKESLSLEEVIDDIIKPLKKPTIFNYQAGHCNPMFTLALGVRARLDADRGELKILEAPTRLE